MARYKSRRLKSTRPEPEPEGPTVTIDDGEDDDEYEPSQDGEDEEEGAELPVITAIWDDEYIDRALIGDKAGWICLWCQEKFKGLNTTKSLAHVSKTVNLGQHVKSCKAAIPDNYKKRYETMANAFKAKRYAKK